VPQKFSFSNSKTQRPRPRLPPRRRGHFLCRPAARPSRLPGRLAPRHPPRSPTPASLPDDRNQALSSTRAGRLAPQRRGQALSPASGAWPPPLQPASRPPRICARLRRPRPRRAPLPRSLASRPSPLPGRRLVATSSLRMSPASPTMPRRGRAKPRRPRHVADEPRAHLTCRRDLRRPSLETLNWVAASLIPKIGLWFGSFCWSMFLLPKCTVQYLFCIWVCLLETVLECVIASADLLKGMGIRAKLHSSLRVPMHPQKFKKPLLGTNFHHDCRSNSHTYKRKAPPSNLL
jgi:hypothetical protein